MMIKGDFLLSNNLDPICKYFYRWVNITLHHFTHPQSAVMLNIYSTGQSALHFEDPLTFKPERWNRDESYELNPFSSLPFGFGPRSCYGKFRKDHCREVCTFPSSPKVNNKSCISLVLFHYHAQVEGWQSWKSTCCWLK